MKQVQSTRAQSGRVSSRDSDRLIPEFWGERLDPEYSYALMTQELFTHKIGLAPRPLFSEDLELKRVREFSLPQRSEQKYRLLFYKCRCNR